MVDIVVNHGRIKAIVEEEIKELKKYGFLDKSEITIGTPLGVTVVLTIVKTEEAFDYPEFHHSNICVFNKDARE